MDAKNQTEILKRDALGRLTRRRADREALLDEFERSGLKGVQFARLAGVKYSTFAYWVQQRRHARGDHVSTRKAWAGKGFATPKVAIEATRSCGLIIGHIKRDLFADGYVQCDETPAKYQDPQREGKCGQGWLWVLHNPVRNISLFVWSLTRGAEALEQIIPSRWSGIIQCDGHSAYEAFIKRPHRKGQLELAGCIAHARRYFFAAKDQSQDARWALAK